MWIDFEGIVNARDLGGIPAADGRRVKPGRLLRGAGLERASDADVARLQNEFHLRHVIDLRDPVECAGHPDRPVPGAKEHNIPAVKQMPRKAPTMETVPDFHALFRTLYADFAESDVTAAAYRGMFRVLLDCPEGAVYLHCTQGKDRTGVGALLILTALGVEEERAKEDYFLSNVGLAASMEEPGAMGVRPWPREVIEKLFLVYPDVLDVFLHSVGERWGGLEGYIRSRIGLTEAEIGRLRRYYLE